MGHFCGNDNRRMKGIDRTTIKQIAMLSMLLDHIGYMFFHGINEGQNAIYITLHLVGRMAFPLFMFLLSDGFFRSRSREKFFLRLFIGAIVSEVPYDLMRFGKWLDFSSQNVMWTLLIFFGYMWVCEMLLSEMDRKFAQKKKIRPGILIRLAIGIVFAAAAWVMHADYGAYGLIAGMIMYIFMKLSAVEETSFLPMNTFGYLIAIAGMSVVWPVTMYALPSALLVYFYKGYCMRKMPKWIGYAFYPGHMLLLWALSWLLNRYGLLPGLYD